MKQDWTLRWWDVLALLALLASAGLAMRASLAPALPQGKDVLEKAQTLTVEVAEVRADWVEKLKAGAPLLDRQGKKMGEIVAVAEYRPTLPGNTGTLQVKIKTQGPLMVVQNFAGFLQEPRPAKAGRWCLLETPHLVARALILDVVQE
jgi:hypothetical protein